MNQAFTRRNAIKVCGAATLMAAGAASIGIPGRAYAAAGKIRIAGSGRPIPQTYSRATDAYKTAFPAGTEFDFVPVASGAQIVAALAGNSLDISLLGLPPTLTAMAAGTDISIIYIQATALKSEGLIARNGSGIKTIKDLKGKQVGVTFNTSTHFALLAAMNVNGLSSNDVRLLNVRPDSLAALWQRGEIDATYTWEPFLGSMAKEGGSRIFESGDLVPHGVLVFDAIVVRNEFKKQYPELVLAYLKEFDRVCQIFRANPESVVKPLADFTKIAPDDVRKFVVSQELVSARDVVSKSWLGKPGEMDAGIYKSMKIQGDFMKQVGQLTSVPASYVPFIDSSFAAKLAGA